MDQKKITLRSLSGVLKDRASLAKASLYTKTRSTVHTTVIKATTHDSLTAPNEYRVANLLSLGLRSYLIAETCLKALTNRLHKTTDSFVALKCLFAIHNIVSQGSGTLRNELSVFPSSGGRNFLNMSAFQETSEYASWVRWYGEFLEQTLITARVIGYFLSPSSSSSATRILRTKRDAMVRVSSSSALCQEIDLLVGLVGVICACPDSVHLQKHDLVYEIVRLVLEDYRVIRYEIRSRLTELERRSVETLGTDDAARVFAALIKLEGCKEKLFLLFVNRANNDGLWEMIGETKPKLARHLTRWDKVPQGRICWTPSRPEIWFPWLGNGKDLIRDSTHAVSTI